MTIWFTGLSGSGKTTLGKKLRDYFHEEGYRVQLLDGDILREGICKGLGFSKKDREENIRRIRCIAEILQWQHVVPIVTAITPYEKMRSMNRNCLGIDYIEVYLHTTLDTCRERDVKGLYKQVDEGKIENFTGIGDSFEYPENPDVVCYTGDETIDESLNKVILHIRSKK